VVPEQALKNDGMLRVSREMLSFSPKAKEMLDHFAEATEEISQVCLRVEITGRSKDGFQYDLQFIEKKDSKEGDIEIVVEGMVVFVDPKSAKYLEGTTLDYQETLMGGGFSFENPNPLWMDEISKAVAEIIETEVNPAVASHGGHVELMGVEDGKAVIVFGGGCQGCGMADVTLKQGVESMIKDHVPSIDEVIDATDHAAGTNPFY
jgi:Fe/S biogenesis protein NfuA